MSRGSAAGAARVTEAELGKFFAHGGPGDAEPLGGLGLVALRELNGLRVEFAFDRLDEGGLHVLHFPAGGGSEQAEDISGQRLARRGPGESCAGEGFAEMVGGDGVAVGQQERFADHVLEFADIAGPRLMLQRSEGVGGDGGIRGANPTSATGEG